MASARWETARLSRAFEVRDGAGYFKDAVVGAGGEALLLHGPLEKPFGVGAQLAVGANLAGGHLGVGVDFFAGLPEALAAGVSRAAITRSRICAEPSAAAPPRSSLY